MIVYSVYSNLCLELSLISVYLLVIVLEAIEVFYQAAESAILGEIVQKDLMEEAVTLSRLDDGIVYIITPLLGALIYKLSSFWMPWADPLMSLAADRRAWGSPSLAAVSNLSTQAMMLLASEAILLALL